MILIGLLIIGITAYIKFDPSLQYDDVHHHLYLFYNAYGKYDGRRKYIKIL